MILHLVAGGFKEVARRPRIDCSRVLPHPGPLQLGEGELLAVLGHYCGTRSLTCARSLFSIRTVMLDVIENILILKDRDRKLRRVTTELTTIDPQRQPMKNN